MDLVPRSQKSEMYLQLHHLILCGYLIIFAAGNENEAELGSLLEFKKGIRNDPLALVFNSWNRSSPLQPNGCPNTWHGIVCDDQTGSITSILLDELGLVGDLKFSTLTSLKNLANLSLAGNSLTGRLVPAMGAMSALQHLDLSRNQFYGPIPARITNLWNLRYLNLSSNNFTGGLPATGARLDNLQQLKVLDLHSNGLWGDIADLFSQLRNVEFLDLSYNMFYGGFSFSGSHNIPSLATNLHYLNLSRNRLNGDFFSNDSIPLFTNLQVLDLAHNQLQGQLPPSFPSLPSLKILLLASNLLYGSIPQSLFQTSIPLEQLDLSANGFSGSIQSINSTTLKLLNLSSNVLSGELPSNFGSCVMLDLSRNMIHGDISVMQNWGDTLEVLDLSSNILSGSIPNLFSQFQTLISVKIRNNSLVGHLPMELAYSPKLSDVDLSINQLSGSIPSSFFTSLTLTNLNLSGNHFTGTISFLGSRSTELLLLPSHPPIQSLDLSNNSLTGSLPSDIGYLGNLKLLNLHNNSLSGQLPNELSKLSLLDYLDLSMNSFTGKIPDRLPSSLKVFNVSYNDLSGPVPENLRSFPISSFQPGNTLLIFPNDMPSRDHSSRVFPDRRHHNSKAAIRVAIIVASIGAAVMILFVLLAYYRAHFHDFHQRTGFSSQTTGSDVKLGRVTRPSLFNFQRNIDTPPTSLSFSNDHLLTSNSRSISGQKDFGTEPVEQGLPGTRFVETEPRKSDARDTHLVSGWRSSPGSPLPLVSNLIETCESSATLNVYSPDRLAGELFFLDHSLVFTAEELSHAPAEVLGRSSHGTLYKATLNNGHVLTVKWLRVGLVKHKKEFAKEAKKIGSFRHPNIVSLRAYYWGPREQERLILADYVGGDSLSLHLYESTPRRYSRLSFSQRLKIALDVALCLCHLHERGLPHGNLKPTNVVLTGPDLTARLTDYGLHRLMTPAGTAEQLLNLRALGYGAPELANVPKPLPSFKADVYALGVLLMELLTRRSAGDIISGQTGAVDLTDWVRLCAHEGRGMDCFDRDIAGGEEPSKAMDDLLATSLKCILPVNERPSIRTVFEDLCSISV